jgi:hypothetical protein
LPTDRLCLDVISMTHGFNALRNEKCDAPRLDCRALQCTPQFTAPLKCLRAATPGWTIEMQCNATQIVCRHARALCPGIQQIECSPVVSRLSSRLSRAHGTSFAVLTSELVATLTDYAHYPYTHWIDESDFGRRHGELIPFALRILNARISWGESQPRMNGREKSQAVPNDGPDACS